MPTPAVRLLYPQVATVEFSLIEVSVMHGLKQGNEVLAQIHKEMRIEDVEKLMSETKEAIAYQNVDLSDLSPVFGH
jgi:hypothetical protein